MQRPVPAIKSTRLIPAFALALISTLLTSAPAHAAACTTSNSYYTGNGTIGVNGTSYVLIQISQTGSCTWTVPAGVTTADVLIVGGGGGGAAGSNAANTYGSGGGGGGGVYLAAGYPLTPGNSLSLNVGAGGTGATPTGVGNTSTGSQGNQTVFDQITAGGGGAGAPTDAASNPGGNGTVGGGGGGTSIWWVAYGYNGSSSTPAPALGGTGSSATVGGKTFPAINGGKGGTYIISSSDNFGGAGGGRGNAVSTTSSQTPGAGFTDSITGTNTEYGHGGSTFGVSGYSAGNNPSGFTYGWGGTGGLATTGGTNGGNGVIFIRYPGAVFNSFGLSGNVTSATYRSTNSIIASMSSPSKVTFFANGKRIPGCVKIATTGSSPSVTATCLWRPAIHGSTSVTAIAYPNGATMNLNMGPVAITVLKRSGTR